MTVGCGLLPCVQQTIHFRSNMETTLKCLWPGVQTQKKITPVTVSTTVPEVRNGVECDAVKVLQTVLTYLGFPCGDIDGDFGKKTEAAVKKYQTAIGIRVDGICGKNTWKYLILGKKKK